MQKACFLQACERVMEKFYLLKYSSGLDAAIFLSLLTSDHMYPSCRKMQTPRHPPTPSEPVA